MQTMILKELSNFPRVAMKLSGVFSGIEELEDWQIENRVFMWARAAFETFGPGRMMWGSDWPVCKIGWARFDENAWKAWLEMAQRIVWRLADDESGQADLAGVWGEVAARVYGV